MDKCVCHINGYAIKDATARKELESVKENVNKISPVVTSNTFHIGQCEARLDALENNGGGKKEAFIHIDTPFLYHNGAMTMFCVHAPYGDNTIKDAIFWDASRGHLTMAQPVKLMATGADINLFFPYGMTGYTITLRNVQLSGGSNVYYYTCYDISVTDPDGNTGDYNSMDGTGICGMLIHSKEA